MKKHWKKIVLVLGIILLSVAGYLVYLFQFKEYEVADEKVDEITKEEFNIKLPDGSTIVLDKDGNVIEKEAEENAEADGVAVGSEDSASEDSTTSGENSADSSSTSTDSGSTSTESGTAAGGTSSSDTTGTSAGGSTSGSEGASGGSDSSAGSGASEGSTGSDGATGSGGSGGSDAPAGSGSSGSGSSGGNGSTGNGDSAGTVTVASIKQKYQPTMTDVEGQANARINSLIGRAKEEYSSKKSNGESINYAYFYNKYVSAANEMESRTDQVFYAVLGSMKKELKANGLAESHAETLVTEYEARKEQRKSELLSQATGM